MNKTLQALLDDMERKSKREKITDILRVIAWLDEKRWSPSNVPFMIRDLSNPVFKTLTWQQQILVHWLCYITDRMRPWEEVWRDGGQVFSKLVKEYSKATIETASDVLEIFSRDQGFMKKPEKGEIDSFVLKVQQEKTYTVRYPDDLYSISRTLVLLLDHRKDLINFISNNSHLWANKQDNIARMSLLLFLLSYNDLDKTFRSLSGRNKDKFLEKVSRYKTSLSHTIANFDRAFSRWNRSEKYKYKRLWAATRDYIKLNYFSQNFLTHFSLPRDWNILFQLEFPGDIWNIRFAKMILKPVLKDERVFGQQVFLESSASKTLRRMFQWLRVGSDYYPEQFDVSFDFAPRMCENGFCDLCPFGTGSIEICFEGKEGGKSCPVALFTCGYRSPCNPNGCPIMEKIGIGLCKHSNVS